MIYRHTRSKIVRYSRPFCNKGVANWAFNVDANSGHAFGILLAAVGALRPSGSGAS